MNKQQVIDIVKGLLVSSGPVYAVLVQVMGIETGQAEKIVQGCFALVSIAGMIWLAIGRTDRNMVVDASTVQGVQVHVNADPKQAIGVAPLPVLAAVEDKAVPDVVPMQGGPVDPAAVKPDGVQ